MFVVSMPVDCSLFQLPTPVTPSTSTATMAAVSPCATAVTLTMTAGITLMKKVVVSGLPFCDSLLWKVNVLISKTVQFTSQLNPFCQL